MIVELDAALREMVRRGVIRTSTYSIDAVRMEPCHFLALLNMLKVYRGFMWAGLNEPRTDERVAANKDFMDKVDNQLNQLLTEMLKDRGMEHTHTPENN